MNWKYKRSDFVRPAAQLEHVDATIRFFEDRVEAEGELHLRAREAMKEITLDLDGKKVAYALDREYAVGEAFTVKVAHVSHPDDVRLEGIYKDSTPKGAPQQFMSQCQQYGFQRIMPIIDDCTAKATFRTTLEGDARYTHLISNGDRVLDERIDGGRRRCVYEMHRPMAPYLFIACAGTWDALQDSVTYPDTGKVVKLEYLVPPGRIDGARIPMEILKKAVLFQHEKTGFEYPFETYRTICMEKSLFGGMENTGNTTIVTDAALIDDTITDKRLMYAYGVIIHEFEHSHCGSGVTMETPFDMWLNEAYTVNLEREFVAREFGEGFVRWQEVKAMREQGGPLAEEEGFAAAPVVREGVNDPDEVVDTITYNKAPEVLNTLKNIIGEETYDKAWREYFRRFDGGNANTDDFIKVFSEVSGRDVGKIMHDWLFEPSPPYIEVSHEWGNGVLKLNVNRFRLFESADTYLTVAITYTAVKDGIDIASGTIVLDGDKDTLTVDVKCKKPDFVSWCRGGDFYGSLTIIAKISEFIDQVHTDSDAINRHDALHILVTDLEPEELGEEYLKLFKDGKTDIASKAVTLAMHVEDFNDRMRRCNVNHNVTMYHLIYFCVANSIGVDTLVANLSETPPTGLDAQSVIRRAWDDVILKLLAEADRPEARAAIRRYVRKAKNMTAKLNGLRALVASKAPDCYKILEEEGKKLRRTLNGYIGWLGVVASDPNPCVFDNIRAEEHRKGWSITHPALSRALYCEMTKNWDQLWTDSGLVWLETTIVKYAKVSEYNANRLLEPVVCWRTIIPQDLNAKVHAMLKRIAAKLPSNKFPFIGGRLDHMLDSDYGDSMFNEYDHIVNDVDDNDSIDQ